MCKSLLLHRSYITLTFLISSPLSKYLILSSPPMKNYLDFFIFLISDLIYLSLLQKSHFQLDSDFEVEALREKSLCLLEIRSWRFPLGSIIFLAKGSALSTASSLFFLGRCFFRAIRLCHRTRGVTRRRSLGALVPGFFPLFRGFLPAHWRTSSSSERLKSLQILLALLGST